MRKGKGGSGEEVVQDTGRKATGFTIDDLWEEIAQSRFGYKAMQKNDITARMFCDQFLLSGEGARQRMMRIAKADPDKWKLLKVVNPENNHPVLVLRRIKEGVE
jgi:hypothetical protein